MSDTEQRSPTEDGMFFIILIVVCRTLCMLCTFGSPLRHTLYNFFLHTYSVQFYWDGRQFVIKNGLAPRVGASYSGLQVHILACLCVCSKAPPGQYISYTPCGKGNIHDPNWDA